MITPESQPPLAHTLVGDGPPVLLLHGLGGDRTQALDLLPAGDRRTRIAPDLPGHGGTDLRDGEPIGFPPFAERVAAMLDALTAAGLAGGPLPVVGVSMGAGVALALAWLRPDLVAHLVLVRPAWLDRSPAPNLDPFSLVASLLTELGPVAGERTFATTPTATTLARVAPAMAASLRGQFHGPHARERARVLAEMPQSLPLPDRAAYGRIDVDVLVLVAPQDPVHPAEYGATLAGWLPRARLGTLPRKLPDPTEHRLETQRAVSEYLNVRDVSC